MLDCVQKMLAYSLMISTPRMGTVEMDIKRARLASLTLLSTGSWNPKARRLRPAMVFNVLLRADFDMSFISVNPV